MVNCFFVREDDGLTLVDTNLPGSTSLILGAAAKLGLPIRRILLTHAHFDHAGSVDGPLAALQKIELLIGVREQRLLAGDQSLDPGESGKWLLGFPKVDAEPTGVLR
jgi:glyoxylase-like metal-dependent hydrolase (beta-lactamase superfamily II)